MMKNISMNNSSNSIEKINSFAYQLCISDNINLKVLWKLLNKFFVEKKYNKHNFENIILEIFTRDFQEFCIDFNKKVSEKDRIYPQKIAESVIRIWNNHQTNKQINEITSLLDLEFKVDYQDQQPSWIKKQDIEINNAHKIYDILNGKNHPTWTIFNWNIVKSTCNNFFQVVSNTKDSNYFMVADRKWKIYSMDHWFTIGKELPKGIEFYCHISGNFLLTKTAQWNTIANNMFQLWYVLEKKENIVQIYNWNYSSNKVFFLIRNNWNMKLIDFYWNIIPTQLSQILTICKINTWNWYEILISWINEKWFFCVEKITDNSHETKIIEQLPIVDWISLIMEQEEDNSVVFGYWDWKLFAYSSKDWVLFVIWEGEKNPIYIDDKWLTFAWINYIEKEYYLIYENKYWDKTLMNRDWEAVFCSWFKQFIWTTKINNTLYWIFSNNEINWWKKITWITISDITWNNTTIGFLRDLKNLNTLTFWLDKKWNPKFKCLRYIKNKWFVTWFSSKANFKPTNIQKWIISKPLIIF